MRRKNITELREWHLRVPGEALSVPVNCSRIGDVFRIESIPLCYDVISYGDIFEADQEGNELVLRRIVKRANRRTYSFLLSETVCESSQLSDPLSIVESVDGFWERFAVGLLLISMPAESAYDPTTAVTALEAKVNEQ